MHEVSATDSVDGDFVSQDAPEAHRGVQAGSDRRGMKNAGRTKSVAVGVGVALLIVLIGALLVAKAARVWR